MFKALRDKIFGSSPESKNRAKSRLHFVLVQDRTGLTNEEMSGFKEELIEVVERYFVVDKNGFDISYEREDEETTLLINSPVLVRRQDDPSKMANGSNNSAMRGSRRKRKRQREESVVANS